MAPFFNPTGKDMNKPTLLLALLLFAAGVTAEDCTFDTDAADSPDFTRKIAECESRGKNNDEVAPAQKASNATRLYEDNTVSPATGISERPIVAPGTLSHHAGEVFVAREGYSLRPNAKFEESVTFAIHRLHVQMAHYCANGWSVEKQWSAPQPSGEEGTFFLYYRFRCDG